jgi:hypothetical protein
MKLPIIGRLLDERFFEYRRRSTSIAGIVATELALLLFAYRYFVEHVMRWDLVAIVLAFVVVKLALMAWYAYTK